jgi:hypothetical protein
MDSPWIKGNPGAAAYLGISLQTFKRLRQLHSIKRVKLPTGTILYRSDWLDEMLEAFVQEDCKLDALVDGVMKDII